MSWVKLDDRFFSHPRAIAAGRDGRALFLAGLCWCKAHLTDGAIPKGVLAQLASQAEVPGRRTATRLEEAGLWIAHPEGWFVHDWAQHQETAEEERTRKAGNAERQRRWRNAQRDPVTGTFRNALLTRNVTPPDTDTYTYTEEEMGTSHHPTTRFGDMSPLNGGGRGGPEDEPVKLGELIEWRP